MGHRVLRAGRRGAEPAANFWMSWGGKPRTLVVLAFISASVLDTVPLPASLPLVPISVSAPPLPRHP